MTFRSGLALSCGLALACCLAAPAARGMEVVIMKSGKRLQVERAYLRPEGWFLQLQGGGSVVIPEAVVKRVSNAASDMQEDRGPVIAATGGWTPPSAGSASSGGGIAPELIRDPEVKLDRSSGDLRMPAAASALGASGAPLGLPANQLTGPGVGQNAPRSLAGQATAKQAPLLGSRGLRRPTTGGLVGQAPVAPGQDPALAGGGLPSLRP